MKHCSSFLRAAAAGAAMFGLAQSSHAGLQLYYNFQEGTGTTAIDSAGVPQNGTLLNGATYATGAGVPAGLNSSTPSTVLALDGDDDFVETGLSPTVFNIDGNKPKAVSAWVYTRAFNNGGIFDTGSNNNGRDFSLRTRGADDQWRAQFWGGTNDYDFTTTSLTPPVTSLNNWVHFVQTYDGTTSTTYLNGNVAGTKVNALDTDPAGRTFAVGVYNAVDNFNGFIDDLALYDQNLTQAQAQALFNGASPTSIPEPGAACLVGSGLLWPLLRRRRASK